MSTHSTSVPAEQRAGSASSAETSVGRASDQPALREPRSARRRLLREPRWLRISTARRVVIGVVGGFFVLLGLVVLPLPIPPPLPSAVVFLPLGFIILATEFVWARRWLDFIIRHTGPLGRAIALAERKATELARRILNHQTNAGDVSGTPSAPVSNCEHTQASAPAPHDAPRQP